MIISLGCVAARTPNSENMTSARCGERNPLDKYETEQFECPFPS